MKLLRPDGLGSGPFQQEIEHGAIGAEPFPARFVEAFDVLTPMDEGTARRVIEVRPVADGDSALFGKFRVELQAAVTIATEPGAIFVIALLN